MSEQQQQQQTPEEIQCEIERTRRELAETVDQLSNKANVKEQARLKGEEVKERVSANPVPLAAAIGAGIALLVVLRLARRR